MSIRGASKAIKRDLNEKLLCDGDSGLDHFGADIFSECFGTPEEIEANPSALLWLANGLYTVTTTVVEAVTSCRIRPKRD